MEPNSAGDHEGLHDIVKPCCELQLFAPHILWELACLSRWLKDSFHGGYSPFMFFRSVFKETWPGVSNFFYYFRISDSYMWFLQAFSIGP